MEDTLKERIEGLLRHRFGAGAAVSHLKLLHGDASTRRYARARLAGAGAPATVIVMILADRGVAMSSEELAVFSDPPTELPYVNIHNFLVSIGVAVPQLYEDAWHTGLLLLEDVGDVALWDALEGRSEDEVRRLFELAIDQLVLIQGAGTAARDDRCLAFRQVFDARLFEWEFEHFIEHSLVKRSARPVPDADLAELRRHFGALSRYLDRQPRVLNHRDYHAWNLFVCDDRIRVIDFQDALLAPAPYDLATLLGDRITPQVVHPRLEGELLNYYAAAWEARGLGGWSREELWDVYSACALQKAFKVVGRFHFLDREKGKAGYLRYIPPTLRQISRLLDQRPDLAPVREILARYFPELRP